MTGAIEILDILSTRCENEVLTAYQQVNARWTLACLKTRIVHTSEALVYQHMVTKKVQLMVIKTLMHKSTKSTNCTENRWSAYIYNALFVELSI